MEDEFRVFHELRPIFHEDPALPAPAPLEPCSPESASFFSVPPAAPVPSSATPVPDAAFLTSTVPPPPSLSYPAEWGSQETKPAIWHAQQPAQGTQPHVRFVTAPHPYARPNPADASQRVKRPMNSFMVFSNEMRPLLQEQNKSLTNNDVSKILGNMWKDMKPEQKKPYIERALSIKAAFNVQHPDYVYTKSPRKRQKNKLADKTYLESLDFHRPLPATPSLATSASLQEDSLSIEPAAEPARRLATPEYVRTVAVKVADEMQCSFENVQCSVL